MKKIHSIVAIAALILMILSCNNSSSQSPKKAKELQSAIKEMMPGLIATSEDGYYMKAKINGKQWTADGMMSPKVVGRIIGYFNGESISLPYDLRNMVEGNKITFSENNATDLFTNDDVGIWGGRKGEMLVTKADDKFAEGTFHFTASASSTNKTLEVTDGFFRIPIIE